jgi:hypothetical protein
MVDSAKRNKILDVIKAQPEYQKGHALVTITEFFDGNDDLGSIGCNLGSYHPGLAHFEKILRLIEAREDVDEVWLMIYDLEEGEWPFSENVFIFGTVAESTIHPMLESLEPSEIHELRVDWPPSRAEHLAGRQCINLWWD